jgi:hypothetical protein
MRSSFLSRLVLFFVLYFSTTFAKAIDISSTVILERYSLVNDYVFEYENGYLRPDGTFLSIYSEFDDYDFYGLTSDDIAPFSGKPVMNESLFDAYHILGYLPKWVRSQSDYTIGFVTYVIVAVSGHGDPNPTVTIITQPESDRIRAGWPAYFYIDAEPWGYLTYQWYFKNKPIPGATLDWLWIDNVTTKQAGLYKCAASSGGTPVFSQSALLQVCLPVVIKKQPVSQSVPAGNKVTFKVSVSGTKPFHFYWYHGTNAIPNGTNASLVIPNAQPSDAGQYGVGIDNGVSFAGSIPVTLSVSP